MQRFPMPFIKNWISASGKILNLKILKQFLLMIILGAITVPSYNLLKEIVLMQNQNLLAYFELSISNFHIPILCIFLLKILPIILINPLLHLLN